MLTKGNVLVVDDEINLCRILSAKLAKDGYDVVAVHDGEQAVEKVRESHFDVVLLDLILPKMDGLTALERIRALDGELPVIIMTACESSEAIEQAMTRGVTAYVNKPFDLDNVVALVRNTSKAGDHPHPAGRNGSHATILFTRNQPITLEVYNGSSSGQYQSRIEDKDDNTITVLTPTREGETIVLPPRTVVRVGLPSKDAFYSFSSPTIGQRDGNPPVTVLDKPNVIYRVQRRQFARILASVPVRYCVVAEQSDPTDAPPVESTWTTGMSRDFSAGGACISVEEDLPAGTMIYIETDPISDAGAISVLGRVTRRVEEETPIGPRYSLGIQFTKVNSNLRSVA